MQNNQSETAIYNPDFKPNDEGIALCPKCNNEMYLGESTSGDGWWHCVSCKNWVVTQPSHHEGQFLGFKTVLLQRNINFNFDYVEYPGGFLKPFCPRCNKHMWVEKMWWDISEGEKEHRCRLVLGYVCEDWQGCGYTQSLKASVPREAFDYLKEFKTKT